MTKKKSKISGDYEVGRGKPPRNSQFKPGQSGNPGGRKKGSSNLSTILKSVMGSEILMSEGTHRRKVPVLEAMIWRQAQEALQGHLRAIDSLLDRYERVVKEEPEIASELPEDDRLIVERALAMRRKAQDRGEDAEEGAPCPTAPTS